MKTFERSMDALDFSTFASSPVISFDAAAMSAESLSLVARSAISASPAVSVSAIYSRAFRWSATRERTAVSIIRTSSWESR